jgi:hypothetical protein
MRSAPPPLEGYAEAADGSMNAGRLDICRFKTSGVIMFRAFAFEAVTRNPSPGTAPFPAEEARSPDPPLRFDTRP